MNNSKSMDERQRQLEQVIAAYFEAVDDGVAVRTEEWVARYSNLNPELAQFFADHRQLDQIVQPVRDRDIASCPADADEAETNVLGDSAEETSPNQPAKQNKRSVDDQTSAKPAQRRLGDYELDLEIGKGAGGVVYAARQTSIGRAVAVKVLRAGLLASKEDRQRFQNEAEAVAQLDHPNIVPIYEVGHFDDHHYFSMKLITGGSLAVQLHRYRDNSRAVAELLVATARAVHHAHQRGVLHRDLKPANILVDDLGQPHVSDFGLAKRLKGDLQRSHTNAVVGTPAYMAPEQAAQAPVTTATDVYGLGAILFALLAGRAPFSGDSVLDTLEKVRSKSPEPPARFNDHVPHDLQVICLKCLEKEPLRRYSSAQDVADDVQRWLDGRPVAARPVGPAMRGWLWCKRNPLLATATALLFGAVVTWIATGTALWRRAENKAETARLAEINASAQRDLALQNESIANRNFHRALDVIDEYFVEVSENRLLHAPGLQPLREDLLKLALRHYQGFITEHGDSPRLQQELAEAHFRVGMISSLIGSHEQATVSLEEARRRFTILSHTENAAATHHRNLASVHNNLGILKQQANELTAAADLYDEAVVIRLRLLEDDPTDLRNRNMLGDTYHNLAKLSSELGDQPAAENWYRRAIDERSQVLSDDPTTDRATLALARTWNSFGHWQWRTSSTQAALVSLNNSHDLWTQLLQQNNDDQDFREGLADALHNLALVESGVGDRKAAAEAYSQALNIRETLVSQNPMVERYRRGLSNTCHSLGLLYQELGKREAATRLFDRAIAIQSRSAADDSEVDPDPADLADRLGAVARLQGQTGLRDQAAETQRHAIEILEELTTRHPRNVRFRQDLGTGLNNLGNLQHRLGRREEARRSLVRAVEVRDALALANPQMAVFQEHLAESCNNLGLAHLYAGDFDTAAELLKRAIEIRTQLVTEAPETVNFVAGLANAQTNLGVVYRKMGKIPETMVANQRALEIRQRLVDENPDVPEFRSALGLSYYNVGGFYVAHQRWDVAIEWYQKSVMVREALMTEYPAVTEYLNDLGRSLNNLASAYKDSGRANEAVELFKKSIEIRRRLTDTSPGIPEYRYDLGRSHWALGRLLSSQGQASESLQWFDRSIAILESMLAEGTNRRTVGQACELARIDRAMANAQVGRHDMAAAEVDQVLDDGISNQLLYKSACVFSVCIAAQPPHDQSPVSKEVADRYAARAIELLIRARVAGYFDDPVHVQDLKQNADLDGLRSRMAFADFVANLDGE